MSDITPTETDLAADDGLTDFDEGMEPNDDAGEDLDLYRTELRGEVDEDLLAGSDDGFESVGGRFAKWVEPTGCADGPTPGAKALLAYLLDRFDYGTNEGTFKCRPNTANPNKWSEHAEGRAVDLGIPMKSKEPQPRVPRPELGDPVVELLLPNAMALGIQVLIWNRTLWSARSPDGRPYLKGHDHYDHVHIGLIPDMAARLNLATIEAILGGASANAPELDGVTHRVDVDTRLNVRDEPATSGAIVTKLRDGAQVVALDDPPHDDGRYRWVKIKAVSGSSIVTGWVADDFLVSEGGAPAPRPKPPVADDTSDATHRVTATGLNLRTDPTTSASIIVELPTGTEVTALPGPTQESDDHRWIKVRATYRGSTHEGWVASNSTATGKWYLEAIG